MKYENHRNNIVVQHLRAEREHKAFSSHSVISLEMSAMVSLVKTLCLCQHCGILAVVQRQDERFPAICCTHSSGVPEILEE